MTKDEVQARIKLTYIVFKIETEGGSELFVDTQEDKITYHETYLQVHRPLKINFNVYYHYIRKITL